MIFIKICVGVLSSSVATRPVTAIKTKGAVAVRLSLFGSSFLFITSHFSGRELHVHVHMDYIMPTFLSL